MLNNQYLFNPQLVPLTDINLIEASAGTGKTWNIAALFLRLLIDDSNGKPPSIEQILVVTFTKAANAELKNRLRKILTDAFFFVNYPDNNNDIFLKSLLSPYLVDNQLLNITKLRLQAAINNFDLAAIYTIHGFCQRVLSDAAFDFAQPFAAELIHDDKLLLLQLTLDFWRKNIVYSSVNAAIVAKEKATPESWLKEIKSFLAKPYLKKIYPNETQIEDISKQRELAWHDLYEFESFDLWCEIFWRDFYPQLNGTVYKKHTFQEVFFSLSKYLKQEISPVINDDLRKNLIKLTPEKLSEKTKKNAKTPKHKLFELLAKWLDVDSLFIEAQSNQLIRLKFDLLEYLNAESVKLRHLSRQRSFDDLLSDLYSALNNDKYGDKLAKNMSELWSVALIDEFQDTDPLQYAIFYKVFAQQGRNLFLVGDPKQAIYSFRGADIFAYLSARNEATRRFTLTSNYRSIPALVDCVNSLFTRDKAFLLDIPYQFVIAASRDCQLQDSEPILPFSWQWLNSQEKPFSKDVAANLVARHCASNIADLLKRAQKSEVLLQQGNTRRAITGGDIAILVSTHRQANLLRQALSERGISSVCLTQNSVWSSSEASEILAIMRVWNSPTDESYLRLALVSELIGLNAQNLANLEQNQSEFSAYQAAFSVERSLYLKHGFMTAWRQCFSKNKIAERLLPMVDGERRLTNITHVCELIAQAAIEKHSLESLLAWVGRCVADPPSNEESLQRIESEENLVNILTIHASKGLQYPIVYLPFLWDASKKASQAEFCCFHQDGEAYLIASKMCNSDQIESIKNEIFAEKIRLLYVALTRAKLRICVYWLPVSGMDGAALSWLLHANNYSNIAELEEKFKQQNPVSILNDLQNMVAQNAGNMDLQIDSISDTNLFLPDKSNRTIKLLSINRYLINSWRVSSFSALTAQHVVLANENIKTEIDLIYEDQILIAENSMFPRGSQAGICLHSALESIDFTDDASKISATIAKVLPRFSFSENHLDAADLLIQNTLYSPIDSGVYLAKIPLNKRISELQFYLPLNFLQVKKLRDILCDEQNSLHPACRLAAAKLDFKTVQGYLKGFIDLIICCDDRFYLIDYKSNYLGDNLLDYSNEKLALVIANSHYYLQYLIYCVALRRYLNSRKINYEQTFSGVRYLFMRGLDRQGNGIWSDLPDIKIILQLDKLF